MNNLIEWHIEERSIKDLKPHPNNPRTLSKDQAFHLGHSIDKFNLIDLPIINTDNMIIGGHQRIQILKKRKDKIVKCWVPNRTLDSNEVDELNVRLNRNVGDWDYDVLANNFDLDKLVEWGFTANDFLDMSDDMIDEGAAGSSQPEDEKCEKCGQKLKKKM